ncbi:unnamed protein product [Arabidopsis halleri]
MCLEIGLGFDSNTVIGRHDSCQEFISAASFFAYLRDNESSKASMTIECAGMCQNCESGCSYLYLIRIYESKAMNLIFCLCFETEVAVYYEEALKALNSPFLKDHFDERWKNHVQFKAALFYSEACVRHEENDTIPAKLQG